jgi:hypothetical protein
MHVSAKIFSRRRKLKKTDDHQFLDNKVYAAAQTFLVHVLAGSEQLCIKILAEKALEGQRRGISNSSHADFRFCFLAIFRFKTSSMSYCTRAGHFNLRFVFF